ncbi:MAG TPA: hypothetical protein VH369_10405 [Bryobacteraceae bacterium]
MPRFRIDSKILIGWLAATLLPAQLPPAPPAPELWYYHHSYLTNEEQVAKSKILIDKAVAAGYTGAVFWDSSFNFMGNSNWSFENEERMKEVMKYANKKHLKSVVTTAPFGYSNDVLSVDPNWAEAQRVTGSRFQVDRSGKRLIFQNSFPGLANHGFEEGKTGWFDTGDQGIGISEAAHAGKAAGVIVDAPGNGRFRQKITLKPWRQYHLRLFYKSSNFTGGPMVEVLDAGNFDKVRFIGYPAANGSHDWTEMSVMFNSQDTTSAYLYFGVWGGSKGMIWFDDIFLEETALVYVAHRAGTPFKVYDPADPQKIYREGSDYTLPIDSDMRPQLPAFHNVYHLPPDFRLPSSTQLKPGQTVAVDSYSAFPLWTANEMAMCLTEPGVYKWIEKNARSVKKAMPPDSAVLLGYDELRQANSCFSCRSKHMSAGELLAWSVGQTIQIYRSVMPGTPLFVWNDMFDPHHNAKDNYYYVEGSLADSWKGLPSDIRIMNWDVDQLRPSLTWFSGLDPKQPVAHPQMIAGFYDKGNGGAEATRELNQAAGIPGIVGMMYTTYADDYSQLQNFAAAAKAGWPGYLASLEGK